MESLDMEPLIMLALGTEWQCNLEMQHEPCMIELKEQQFTCDEGRLGCQNLEPFVRHEGPHNCADGVSTHTWSRTCDACAESDPSAKWM